MIVLASLPSLLSQMYYGRFGWQLMHRQASLYRKQNYLASLMTSDSHAKEIRLFGLGDHLLGRYVETAQDVIRQDWDFRSRAGAARPCSACSPPPSAPAPTSTPSSRPATSASAT